MALRVVYPSFQCMRSQPYCSFNDDDEDDVSSWLFSPRLRRRRRICNKGSLFREFESLLQRYGKETPETSNSESMDKSKQVATNTDDKFNLKFNLSGFEPNDIKVKTVGRKVIVEAENEERSERDGCQSYSKKHYHRSIVLPENVRPDDVTSILNDEGVLRITAPRLALPAPKEEERNIEIEKEDKVEVADVGAEEDEDNDVETKQSSD